MESKVMDTSMDQEVPPDGKGFKKLLGACRKFYLDQPNPFQFCPTFKYWQGGLYPLDVIHVYSNPGNPAIDIAPHWHYISFGLSDLYGDARLFQKSKKKKWSGYGFELTFRLEKKPDEHTPPRWPESMVQSVTNHTFRWNTSFCIGDYLSFVPLLDSGKYSRIENLMFTEDPQLQTVKTPFGRVEFLQMVGICAEEFEVAQKAGGEDVIELMKTVKGAGGPWLVTDMRRDKTVFELSKAVKSCDTFDHSWLPWCSGSVKQVTTLVKKNNSVLPRRLLIASNINTVYYYERVIKVLFKKIIITL